MSDLLTSLRLSALSQLGTMGALRWFTPTPLFWETMQEFKDKTLVDCGCGVGALVTEGRRLSFEMIGIDLVKRKAQIKDVLFADACSFPFGTDRYPLICRPDHSGWVYDTIKYAVSRNATAFYVGLAENVRRDLESHIHKVSDIVRNVGIENESLYIIRST